jgi:putative ABC transport system ATP-binding protein/lipoprotein-releasing system ATP-binding protein
MAIELNNVHQTLGDPPNHILKNISLKIEEGEFVALTGRSGSGKSTLLYVMSSLDKASQGEVLIDQHNLLTMSKEFLHRFRNEHMGFVFQFHYLLPELSSLENILMPARKFHREQSLRPKALELLEAFGLSQQAHRLPRHLSGGEQQRVAIARSLIMTPKYLFADEPTGNLDSQNGQVVMDIFHKINKTEGTTIIFVTHDPGFAAMAHRQIILVDGHISKGG